jgi:hypothetical protein
MARLLPGKKVDTIDRMTNRHDRSKKMISVKGILIPVNWDKSGNVLSVAIATGDEDEYLVDDQGSLVDLKPLLRKEVEVCGTVKRRYGKKTIKVKAWKCQNA